MFLESGRAGTDLNISAKETAIAVSFALQHGCTGEMMRDAMPRRVDGSPEGPVGVLLDMIGDAHD